MGLGSISFVQEPVNATSKVPVITNWTPLIGYMVYQDDVSSLFYFKFILEVYTGTSAVAANLIGKIKQRPNGYSVDIGADEARAFFDLRSIVNSVLTPTVFDQNDTGIPFNTIHKLGSNTAAKPFSINGDNTTDGTQIQSIYVKAYQEYSEAATSSPAEDDSETVNHTLYYLESSLPLMTARSTVVSPVGYIQSTAFNVYNCSGATDKFLSDLQTDSGEYNLAGYINYLQWNDATEVGDYHTVAFLNDNDKFDSHIDKMRIIYYTAAGASINSTDINNISDNGGEAPTDGSLTDSERLLYFGSGTANLEAQSVGANAKPSNNSNWAYYTIQGMDGSSNPMTALYYFIKEDGSCKGFQVRRLAWRNSVGGYDYFNFKKKSTQTTTVTRNNYNSMLGTFNKSLWRYNNTQRGKTTRQTTAILKETLNTDWITEAQGSLIEKLIMSADVYIVENADTTYTEPVIITDTSFVKKTSANDKMIQYTINIEYANPVNTNS